jgi:hypothetical protein
MRRGTCSNKLRLDNKGRTAGWWLLLPEQHEFALLSTKQHEAQATCTNRTRHPSGECIALIHGSAGGVNSTYLAQ